MCIQEGGLPSMQNGWLLHPNQEPMAPQLGDGGHGLVLL